MSVQINVQASQSALAQSIAQGVAAFNSRYAGQNQLNLQINARAFSQPLGRITSDLADFESALKASNARVLAFGASTAVLGGVVRSFKEIANVTIEVEKSLTDINRVLNLSTNNLQKFSSELFSISKQTASSFDDATKAALEFSRQGLNTEETLKRTADALTLVRLTGISSTKAVEDLTATINGFAKAGLTTSQVVNKLAAVEQDFAVSATDLTEALSRTGQAAQEAGVSFDELNALVTTAQQNTARGGAVIGNALKTIFTRLQRTETLDQLQNFNIAVRDIEGNILPAVQILKNFADRYNDLADAQRAQLSEQVAGVYQVNILKGVIKDLNNSQGTYVQALERGAMAANEADIANEKLNKTLSALVTQTGVGLQQLANNVGKVTFAPIFEAIVSPVNDAVSYINDTLEGEGIGSIFANGLLKGVRNVIAGPGLAVAFAVIAKVAKNTFEDATKALPAILGLTTEAQKRANIEKSIISILQTQSNLSLALQGQQGNLSSQAATVLNYAKLQTAQYQQQLQIAQQLAPLLAAQNVTVGSRGIQVGPKIKAGGHIPAFAEMSERMGAAMGGYKSGKVVKAPKSVGANTYMNSAEEVKYISGFAQPFINPPANSKAGRAHRQNAINRTGVDPYMAAKGFIPNFAYKNFGFKNNELNLNRQSIKDFSDPSYFEKRNLADGGLNKNGKPNDIYDTVSGVVQRIPFVKKKQFNLQAEKYFSAYLKDEPLPFVVKQSYDRAFNKIKNAGFYGKVGSSASDIKNVKNQMLDKFNAKNKGDFYNFRGSLYESYVAKKAGSQYKLAESEYSRSDVVPIDPEIAGLFTGIEAKSGSTGGNWKILQKAIETAIEQKQTSFNEDTLQDIPIGKYAVYQTYNDGFIPNFATPLSTARIPWFKKYSSKYKNIAGDTDLFKMGDFPTYGRGLDHEYAKKGNSSMLSYLHEDFVRSAINIALGSKKVIRPSEVGFKNKPISEISNENDFDLLYKLADGSYSMLELKQDFKNISGSITGFMNKKLENLKKENPELAKKVSSMIAVSNMPKFIDPTGKNPAGQFSEFEMAISSIVKDKYSNVDPTISAKLTKVTDGLLRRYEAKKNTNSKGFIPNFADFIKTEIDAILQPISKSKTIKSKQLFGKTLDDDAIKYLNITTLDRLNKFLYADGYLDVALGFPFGDRAYKKYLFTKNKGFIPNFSQLMKGYAFNDGRIYNDVYHSDALDSIEGSPEGAIKYAYHNNKLLLQTNKAISPILKKAFLSRGVPESAFSPVEDVDSMMRSKNKQEIDDKLSQLGAVQLSEGIKAIYENGRYTTFIKDNKSLRILGGITPDELKMYGGVDRFLAYRERVHGVQKWQSFANGFIPNFANYNNDALERMTMEFAQKGKNGATLQDFTQFVIDLNNNKYGVGDSFHKDIIAKNFGEIVSDNDLVSPRYANTYLKGSYDKNSGKVIYYKSKIQQLDPLFERKHPYIKTVENELKVRFAKLQQYAPVKRRIETDYGTFHKQHPGPSTVNHFNNGFIPNFNFIKGRNSFQKNWLIETAKKRNLNLNDPNVFHQLATEFAKRYPNDQGMFGLNKGFIPNFAYKQSVMSLEESMSGNKAIFDTKPFPHIRNSSQPTFSSAIADHGGLGNALSDSMRGQKAAGLMNKGFVPNFATLNAQQALGIPFRGLGANEQKLFVDMNKALSELTRNTKLTSQQQQILVNTVQTNALTLQQNTKSASIVNDANNALVKALQQNANAQQKAAAQTTAQAAQQQAAAAQAAAQNVQQQAQLSGIERIGKFLGGAKGAARGAKIESSFGKLSNNIGFTLGVPMLAGVAESFISQNKDRSEMGYAQRLASSGTSAALSGATTGALLGSVVPGIGNALGAAIGATVGFSGAALNARTSLDDLSKSINTVIDRNKKDVDAAKTIGELEKQMAGETDPFAIAVLKMKIQEAADTISNTEFAKKLLDSSQSVEEFNRTINEFVLSSGPLNQLGNLPSLIQSFSKKTGTLEARSVGYVKETFTGNIQNIFGIYSGKIEKKLKYAAELAGSFFDPIGVTFLNIQEQIAKKSPEAAKNFSDILNNVLEFRESGVLESKLKTLVDSKDIPQQVADQILKIVDKTNNSYFDLYLSNLKARLPFLKDQIKKSAPIREGRVADIESSKVVFAKINNEIQNALNEATLQLMNIEFKSNIGKLNIEKIGGIFDTAASAIGKNLESIAKSQFDALMVQIQLSREAQLADLNRTQFEETRSQEMNKYLAERKSRVSTFFEKNIAPGESSRKLAVEALSKIGSDLSYDFKNLESLAYNMGVDVENARKELIRNEEFQKRSFLTQRSNAETLFDQEQSFAKQMRDLKKKASEEDLKLEEIKYANLLKEKQIIQSFDFANQARQIQTQAEVSRMGLGMEVNPNFFAGASRFQQEDYKFRLDREKEDKRIATEIRNATEQQRIVDIQRQVISANTNATNENTKAIREYTIAFLNQQLSKVESGLSESKNASEKIEKIVTKIPDEKAPLNRKKTFADPENYVEKSFRFFNQAPQNNLIPGTNIDRRAGVNNYDWQNSTPKTPASEDKSPSLFEKSLDRFINFLNSTYSPKSRVLSDGPIYSGGQSFIQSEDTNIPQYKGADFLNFLNEGDRYVDAKQTSNAVTTAENREIEVQRELTAEKQKQVELENQRKNINQQLQSIIKERTSTVQSSVSSISPDLSRVSIAKDELERLSGQLKINETSLAKLEAERKTTKESSRQVQLDQQIFDLQEKINKGKLDQLNYTEQIATIEERIKANNEYLASRGKFSTGVAKAMGSIKDETEMFKETLGTTTVNAFRDGLVGAMDAALNKADDLESALMGVAAGFLREIQGVMLRNIANNIVGGIGSAFSFGQPAATNQKGGLIRAQSGMYISGGRTGDKNPALLEDGEYVLNRNAVKALGGPRAIDQLNFNAFPRFANGGDPGTMSASISMGEPFERLSMYGREQSPEYQNYLERLREEEAARERKRAERKALINSLITTAITTGVMMGLTSGVQGLKNKFGSKTPLNKVAGSKPNLAQRAQLKKAGVSIGPDGLPAMQTGGAIGLNQGGFLPYGSRLTDSIPAYLTGGEYVINSRAVRKYGVGGLNRINSGVARFQDGGMVGDGMSPSSNSSNTSNSNISINITVNANNGKVGDQESDSTGDNTESNSKELSNRIKAVVLDVITTEQRSGGLLDSTKKK